MDNMNCQGTENSIFDCPYDAQGTCDKFEGAGVMCQTIGKQTVTYCMLSNKLL